MNAALKYIVPATVGMAALALWEWRVRESGISPLVLAAPSDIWAAFVANFSVLMSALWTTLRVTLIAFSFAVAGGVLVAILFSQSRLIEFALYPFAIILQVTPVVAIAPLLLIWIGYDNITAVLVVLAWIISFFSILSNMVVGLRSADHNLVDLFRLYGASRFQIFARLQLPGALPYLLSGMKVSGGLALIGAVTAELVAGAGNDKGLGWVITPARHNLEKAKGLAGVALLSTLGIAIFFALTALEWLLLHRWHESAVKKQS
jgi:NitT/TauT family transport system permease protein